MGACRGTTWYCEKADVTQQLLSLKANRAYRSMSLLIKKYIAEKCNEILIATIPAMQQPIGIFPKMSDVQFDYKRMFRLQ